MTVFELESALVEFIVQNTYELEYYSNEQTDQKIAPRIYSGFIPRDVAGSVIPGEITTYPAIIINARRGTQAWDSEMVEVEVLIGIFDRIQKDIRGNVLPHQDQQGYRDVTNLVQRLKDRFREIDIVRERFPIRMPLKWEVNRFYGGATSNYYPYFFGEMLLNFELPVMTTQYDITSMDGETTPGRYNEFPIPANPPAPLYERQ